MKMDLNSFSFSIPPEVKLDIESKKTKSDQLGTLRWWIHGNDEINHDTRSQYHLELLQFTRKSNSLYDTAKSLFYLAKTYDRMGKFNDSLNCSIEARTCWKKLTEEDPDHLQNLVISYCDISVTQRLQNKLNDSLATLYQGYDLLKKNGTYPENALIVLLGELGTVYADIKDYPSSVKYYNEVLETIQSSTEKNKYIENKIIAHMNLGNVYFEQNMFSETIQEFKAVSAMTEKYPRFYHHEYINQYNLGIAYLESGKKKTALKCFLNTLDICRKSGSSMEEGFIQIHICKTYLAMKNLTEAENWLKIGMKNVKAGGSPIDLIEAYKARAMVQTEKGEHTQALRSLKTALKICQSNSYPNEIAEIFKDMYRVYQKMGQFADAIKFADKYANEISKSSHEQFQAILQEKQLALSRVHEEFEVMKQDEENKRLKLEIDHKNRELASKALFSASNRNFLEQTIKSLRKFKDEENPLKNVVSILNTRLRDTQDWDAFESRFNDVHPDFLNKLKSKNPELSPMEIRICTLDKMGFDNRETAGLLGISSRGVEQHRYRIKKKLELEINLTSFLNNL